MNQDVANQIIRIGPFALTGEIGIASLLSFVTLLAIAYRLVRHLTIVDERVAQLWTALMGDGPQDAESFFNRFQALELKVSQIWKRLGFEKGHLS
jgi:hypothetical protein